MTMAITIRSGAKNNKAAPATATSNIRFLIEADGSLRMARCECLLRYTRLPAHSTGRTDMGRRPNWIGMTLS
jgi:hypothetical protein